MSEVKRGWAENEPVGRDELGRAHDEEKYLEMQPKTPLHQRRIR
jgi:hypothetical protein